MATSAQCAAHVFLSERRFRELIDAGVITHKDRGAYDLDEVRREYIAHIREGAAGRVAASAGGLDPTQERARKDKELADKVALANQVTRGELVLAADAERAWTAMISIARERLLAMPSKLGPRLVMVGSAVEVQGAIEAEVHAALTELSSAEIVGSDDSDVAGSSGV